MASEVSICNLALARIGEEGTVVNLNPPEGGEHAASCAAFYQTSVAAVLSEHNWRFATRRTPLAKLSSVETYGWKAAYSLPSNFLRLIDIRSLVDQRHRYRVSSEDYEVEVDGSQPRLYTDCENPVCRYVISNPAVSSFSALFVDALAWHIAMSLAGRVIKGKEGAQMVSVCSQQYRLTLDKAAKADAAEKDLPIDFEASWIKVR